jgi:DNA-binding transcriptional LysR family regulator
LSRALGDGVLSDDRLRSRVVHIGGPVEFTTTMVIPALAHLPAAGAALRFTLGLADDLLARLAAGELDLVISTVRPRRRGITSAPLYDEEFALVGAPTWAGRLPPERLAAEGAKALADVPVLAYAEDMPIVRRYWRHVFGTRPTSSAAIVIPDLRGVQSAATAGSGITVLPRYVCSDDLASGRLIVLHDPPDPPINTIFLAARAGAPTDTHLSNVHHTLLQQARMW